MSEHKAMKQYGENGYEDKLSGCWGVASLTHPKLAPRLKIEYSCVSPSLWTFKASSIVKNTFYLYLRLLSFPEDQASWLTPLNLLP